MIASSRQSSESLGSRLAELEAAKVLAIANEEYVKANSLKGEVEVVRVAIAKVLPPIYILELLRTAVKQVPKVPRIQ